MNTPEIPDVFRQIAALGFPIQAYPFPSKRRWVGLITAGLLWVLTLGLMVVGAYVVYNAMQRLGPAVFWRELTPWLIFVVIAGAFALWASVSILFNWQKMAVRYRDGLAYRTLTNLVQLRWSDIAGMKQAITRHYTNGIYTGTTHVYTLLPRQGKPVILDDSLTDVEALAEEIRKATYPLMLQQASQALANGNPVSFGPITINQATGLSGGKQRFAWNEIERIHLERGQITVRRSGKGGNYSVPISEVPNFEVMLTLVEPLARITTPNK